MSLKMIYRVQHRCFVNHLRDMRARPVNPSLVHPSTGALRFCIQFPRLLSLFITLVLCALWPWRGWSDTSEVCHVGAQLHLQNGVPEETYLPHVRAFVEEGMADYVLLLAYSLDGAGRETVARCLKEHNVHFFVQEQLKPEQWHP